MVGKTTDDIAVILSDKSPQEKLNSFDFRYLFKIEVYPSYNQQLEKGFKYNSDIAVLTLEEPVLLTSKINPICLPPLTESDQTYEGKTATVAGWGLTETGKTSTDQLMSVDIPIISNQRCRTFYNWIKRYDEDLYQLDFNTSLLPFLAVTFVHIRKALDTVTVTQVDLSVLRIKTTGKYFWLRQEPKKRES